MPTQPANPHENLKEVIGRGGAVIVAGSGVSMAASLDASTGKPHPQASWAGLLENGLEWLKQNNLITSDEAAAHITFLKSKRLGIHHFISAAQDVTRLMGGVESQHFSEWLKRTIGSIVAHDRHALDALDALRCHGNLLATTNYDGLLLDQGGKLKPVTWKEQDSFLRASRNKEIEKIIFLHGYWRQPESVILDWNSYEQIARDDLYRQDLDAVWKMTTWLYVGCGVSGLNDPDLGLLIERHGKRARNAGLWDFCLVLNNQREEFQAHFDKLGVNICAVPFGVSHDQLPAYLRSLLPAAIAPEPATAAVVLPPVDPIIEFLRVNDNFFQYRASTVAAGNAAPVSRGDFRFTADEFRSGAVHRAQVVDVALQRLSRDGCVWLEGPSAGGKTTVCLHLVSEWDHQGCEPLYLDLAEKTDAEQAVREIAVHARLGRLFILDNVHEAPKLACALLDQWRTHRRDSVMVLLGWPAAVHPGHDYLSGHRGAVVTVAVQPEDWIGVYQSTFRHIRGSKHVPPAPPPEMVKEWDDTFAADLVTFQYALAAGLRLGAGNSFRIERAAADRYVREKYLDPCSDKERSDLFLLAWFSEVGMPLAEELVPSRFKHSLSCGLIRPIFYGRLRNRILFQPWHRSFARLLLSLAPNSERSQGLREVASSHPFWCYQLANSLQNNAEKRLAIDILEHALDRTPSLVDWLDESLSICFGLFLQIKELVPSRWAAAIEQISTTIELDKLVAKTFKTSLNHLLNFLRFTGKSAELKAVHKAVCKVLDDDAQLPVSQGRLQAQVFVAPLHILVTFLRFTGDSENQLKSVHESVCNALTTDAQLPAGQSCLLAQAIATPLNILVTFLRFTGQPENQLKLVHEAVCNALTTDAQLPAGQSRLQAQAIATPLDILVTFLRFTGKPENQLKAVHEAVCKVLNTDAQLPAGQGRLYAKVFVGPLHFLVTFLRFAGNSENQLKPIHEAVCKVLNADAHLPASQGRLHAKVFDASLHFLVTFLRFTGDSENQLSSVHEAVCKALTDDAQLPADQSQLMRIAREMKGSDLYSFLNGLRSIPETAALAGMIERDLDCAKVLLIEVHSKPPLVFQVQKTAKPLTLKTDSPAASPILLKIGSQLDEKIQEGKERVITGAWKSVSADRPAEDRFRIARIKALEIISGLSPYIKRHVGAYFHSNNWEPLKVRDPNV